MIFNIVHPFMLPIHAVSLNEGIKDFVKIHRFLEINDMIVQDRDKMFKANMKYLKNDTRNKVGIDIVPYSGPVIQSPTYQTFVQTYFPMYTYIQNGGSIRNVGFGVRSPPFHQRGLRLIPHYGIHPTLGTPIYRIHDLRPEKPEFKGANFESFKNDSGSIETSVGDLEEMFTRYNDEKRSDDEKKTIKEKEEQIEKLKEEIGKLTEEISKNSDPTKEKEKKEKEGALKTAEEELEKLNTISPKVLSEFLKELFDEKKSSIPKDFIDHYHHLSSLPSSMPVRHNHDNLPIHTHKNLKGLIPTSTVPGILRFIYR